jgi:tetratricopeptide (TPR) repeat protein
LTNAVSLNARALKSALLRRLGRKSYVQTLIDETPVIDRLSFRIMAEHFLLTRAQRDLSAFMTALDCDIQTLLDVSYELAWSGLREDAFVFLQSCVPDSKWDYPILWYILSWLATSLGHEQESIQYTAKGEAASARYCSPARLEEMIVLEEIVKRNPSCARAHYYPGNLFYDKRRYEDAIRCWRRSIQLDDLFSIPFRNLGIAEFKILHNAEAAGQMYASAFKASPLDARVFYEWDQLKKRAGLATPEERLRALGEHKDLVARRDDLTVEYITLLNQRGQWQSALEHLSERRFSPWEGGEGLLSGQYVQAHRALGVAVLCEGRSLDALEHFEAARHYPMNLGEGRHLLTLERDLDYFSGLAAESLEMRSERRIIGKQPPHCCRPWVLTFTFKRSACGPLATSRRHMRSLNLEAFAAKQMEAEPTIDYFATSLSNMLLFDDDLHKRNRIESLLLITLASQGLGNVEMAACLLQRVVDADPNYLLAAGMLGWIKQYHRLVLDRTEEGAAE